MIGPLPGVAVLLRPGPTDMRKSFATLAALAQQAMGENPLSGALFVFCNRRATTVKVLYWDRNGFCLWSKRLEKHRFPWPRSGDTVRRMRLDELWCLLDGVDPATVEFHETLPYERVC